GERSLTVLAGGEQHLVEVGKRQFLALQRPRAGLAKGVERRQLVVGGCRPRPLPGPIAVPHGGGRRLHVVVGAAADDRLRVVLRVPTRLGVVVLLVQEQPLLLAPLLVPADE